MKKLLCTSVFLIGLLGTAPLATAGPRDPEGWKNLPVIPRIAGGVKVQFKEDLLRAQRHSMRARVFAKVGDSNTEMAPALYGLACRSPRLAGRRQLQAVIDRYNQVTLPNERPMPGCSPSTSFSRRSAAVASGTFSSWSIEPLAELPEEGINSRSPFCDRSEGATSLSCEINAIHPRYSLIMTGTNDIFMDAYFKHPQGRLTVRRISSVINEVRRLGSVPVLSTLAPFKDEHAIPGALEKINSGIARAARKKRVPLINLWRALNMPGMINDGMDDLGRHLRAMPGGVSPVLEPAATTFADAVDFRPPALRFGSNRRNLIWVQTLKALDEAAR
jgi:hypothetical protein